MWNFDSIFSKYKFRLINYRFHTGAKKIERSLTRTGRIAGKLKLCRKQECSSVLVLPGRLVRPCVGWGDFCPRLARTNLFQNLIKSNRNWIVFIIFRVIWNSKRTVSVFCSKSIGKCITKSDCCRNYGPGTADFLLQPLLSFLQVTYRETNVSNGGPETPRTSQLHGMQGVLN